jgi:hypothetical protein
MIACSFYEERGALLHDRLKIWFEPIPRKHIEEAAAKAGIRSDDIDAQVASLSAYLGWDVTVGAKKKAVKRTGRSNPGRKRRHG